MAGRKIIKGRKERWEAYTKQDQAIARLCEDLLNAQIGLATWCRINDFSYNAVRSWIGSDAERDAAYAQAREDRADAMAEDIVAIADDMPPLDQQGKVDSGWVSWQKGRVDARKWTAAKLKPNSYGDKTAEVTVNNVIGKIERLIIGND